MLFDDITTIIHDISLTGWIVLLSLLNTHHGESFSWRGVHKEMMATLQ